MRNYIDSTLRIVLVGLMGSLVLTVIWQVVSRYVLQSPSIVTDELARFLLIWVSLLGAAYYSGRNEHIAIDILPRRLSPVNQYRLQLFTAMLIALFVALVFVVGGGYLVWITYTYTQITPALQIPMAWVYSVGPLSGLFIICYKVSDIYRLLSDGPATDINSPATSQSA